VALGADQLGVSAIFSDGSTFDNQDAIGPFDRGQAVGNDEYRMFFISLLLYLRKTCTIICTYHPWR
jgi:hypothetical protein